MDMSSLSRSLNPHLQIKEEPAKQGIVTILPSDSEKTTTTKQSSSTIRRTLSADMSSIHQNGFFKKISSHQEIANLVTIPCDNSSSSSEDTSDRNGPGQDEVWRSIQSQKEKSDVWGTNSVILTQKSATDLPPPYIHPLVRKAGNTLNEKSLEICTENLGSETGSDGFSPSDDDGDEDRNKEVEEKEEIIIINLFEVVKYNKRSVASPVRPFPPPLPSIDGAASLQMQSHRKNGRLVVEAVSVPSRNCFHSQRKNGRLVLTMTINTPKNEQLLYDNNNNNIDAKEEVTSLPNADKSGLLKNPTSFKKFNKTVNMMEAEEEAVLVPKSLPMPPRVPRMMITSPPPPCATTATFNTYNYFWRNTNAVSGGKNSYNNKKAAYEHHQDLVLMRRNKTEYFVPYIKGCNEGRRRPVSIWAPYCIATT